MWWYVIFVVLWILKIAGAYGEPLSKERRVAYAMVWPFLVLGLAFLWNIWGRHFIGWPEIKTIQELVLRSCLSIN